MIAGADTEIEANYNVLYRHLPIDPGSITKGVLYYESDSGIRYYTMLFYD